MIHEQPNVEYETSIHKQITYLMNKIIQSKIPPILDQTTLIKICRKGKILVCHRVMIEPSQDACHELKVMSIEVTCLKNHEPIIPQGMFQPNNRRRKKKI